VTGTARALGVSVMTAGNAALASSMLEQWTPKVVFVDLAAGDLVRPEALIAYRQVVPDAQFVAFGSHVDRDALDAAASAGCDRVMPRSKFSAELPDLMRELFGLSPGL
jgi:DNA-binding NarL/FixJ family response regulator